MAQYNFRVVFVGENEAPTYVVRANDSRQAVRRAQRQHRQEQAQLNPFGVPSNPEGRIRVRSLTPKEADGSFLPRVGGLVIGDPCATEQEALDIAITQSLEIMMRERS